MLIAQTRSLTSGGVHKQCAFHQDDVAAALTVGITPTAVATQVFERAMQSKAEASLERQAHGETAKYV